MKPYYNTKYYVIESTFYPNENYGLKVFDKSKYYRIYNIHNSGNRYNIIEGDIKNSENSFHIDKTAFNELFFTIYELRKIKLNKLNDL
jgi:hypothetical protein